MKTKTKLVQMLIDGRSMTTAAKNSIYAPEGVPMLMVDDPLAAPLTAGNVMLLVADQPPITIVGWSITALQFTRELKNGTLLANCANLHKTSSWSYLLISGTIVPSPDAIKCEVNGQSSNLEWRAVQGALLTIAEIGVQVVWIGLDKRLGETLLWIADRDRSTKKLQPARETLFATPAEQILTALPGIGPERADALLRSVGGDLTLALNALTDPDREAPGIPKSVREDARKVFGLPDDCVLGAVAPMNDIPF